MTANSQQAVIPLSKTTFLQFPASPEQISVISDPSSCCVFSIHLIPSNPTEKSTDPIRGNKIFRIFNSLFWKNIMIFFKGGIVKGLAN